MIASVTGAVQAVRLDAAVVDVGGVGMLVQATPATLAGLRPGQRATLHTSLVVREDSLTLYGFADADEREWFRLLCTVQGVGTKVALALLSALRPSELASAIALKDVTALCRANGVGKKLAERLAQELKDKAPSFASVDPSLVRLTGGIAEKTAPKPLADAVSALVNLGYPQLQASAAVAAAAKSAGEDASTEKLIRLGLKELALG